MGQAGKGQVVGMVINPTSGSETTIDVEWTTEAPESEGRNSQSCLNQGVWLEERQEQVDAERRIEVWTAVAEGDASGGEEGAMVLSRSRGE